MLKKSIFGNGFIAKSLVKLNPYLKKKNFVIYCSGISNSLEKSKYKLEKEVKVLKKFYKKFKNKYIIYISSSSVLDSSRNKSEYLKNKIKIEELIKNKFQKYLIIRLPEIIGNSRNPNTLTNFFYNNIIKKKKFIIFKNSKRNFIDIEDVFKIIKIIVLKININKKIITLCNKYNNSPKEIVQLLETIVNKKANYKEINVKKQNWRLNYSSISKYVKETDIKFNKYYLKKILFKYYK